MLGWGYLEKLGYLCSPGIEKKKREKERGKEGEREGEEERKGEEKRKESGEKSIEEQVCGFQWLQKGVQGRDSWPDSSSGCLSPHPVASGAWLTL